MAPLQGDCHGNSCAVWGSDNGNSLSDGTMHGQFAIYVSSAVSAPNFNCENAMLTLEISEFTTALGDPLCAFWQQVRAHGADGCAGGWLVIRRR